MREVNDNGVANCKDKIFRFPLNGLYFLTVLGFLLWPCVYIIVHAFQSSNIKHFTTNIFSFLLVVQYLIGVIYYQKNHFAIIVKKTAEYEKYINICYWIGLLISIIYCSIFIAFVISGINMGIYSSMTENISIGKMIILSIIIFITKWYSFNIFVANGIFFASTFIIHSQQIRLYVNKLENFIDTHTLTIHSIIEEYTSLKSEHAMSVKNLNNLFSYTFVLGFISAYFITVNYDTDFITPFHYLQIISLLLITSCFLYSIKKVKDDVGTITNIINSPNFIRMYLNREEFEELPGDIIREESNLFSGSSINEAILMARHNETNEGDHSMSFIKEITLRSMIKDHENSQSLDWLILIVKLSGSWESFQILGFNIDDTTITQRSIGIAIFFLSLLGISTKFGIGS